MTFAPREFFVGKLRFGDIIKSDRFVHLKRHSVNLSDPGEVEGEKYCDPDLTDPTRAQAQFMVLNTVTCGDMHAFGGDTWRETYCVRLNDDGTLGKEVVKFRPGSYGGTYIQKVMLVGRMKLGIIEEPTPDRDPQPEY